MCILSDLNWLILADIAGTAVNVLQGKHVPRYFIKRLWAKSLHSVEQQQYWEEVISQPRSRKQVFIYFFSCNVLKNSVIKDSAWVLNRCRTNFVFPKEATKSALCVLEWTLREFLLLQLQSVIFLKRNQKGFWHEQEGTRVAMGNSH